MGSRLAELATRREELIARSRALRGEFRDNAERIHDRLAWVDRVVNRRSSASPFWSDSLGSRGSCPPLRWKAHRLVDWNRVSLRPDGVGRLSNGSSRRRRPTGEVAGVTGAPVAKLRLEKKGRGGKAVTIVYDLALEPSQLDELARDLKRALGTGGSIADGTVELQGDRRDRLREILVALDLRPAHEQALHAEDQPAQARRPRQVVRHPVPSGEPPRSEADVVSRAAGRSLARVRVRRPNRPRQGCLDIFSGCETRAYPTPITFRHQGDRSGDRR